MTTYKDRGGVAINHYRTFSSHGYAESSITCGSHTGTHVDAPAHFINHGMTIDQIDLAKLIGPAVIIDLSSVQEKIEVDHLMPHTDIIREGVIILLKTRNSFLHNTATFCNSFVYLSAQAADSDNTEEFSKMRI